MERKCDLLISGVGESHRSSREAVAAYVIQEMMKRDREEEASRESGTGS